ncbi:hypothetical protein SAMN05216559_2297 [Halomicrobium zhouii]|uniref:Uncharacterized protein n=1 Tax=Halomicrobium zhouii TaxID=767519 RepID=A0A1I6L998_9EURY|nr:hypothetical protein [Halomicrobium zhouii]SFS00022.1 hypothetical protein SAMN05216559_2297 [Halomicrobium zhouii]
MDDILSYALIITIGLVATTILSALVGAPLPVVLPSIVSVLAVDGHYHMHSNIDQDVADLATVRITVENVTVWPIVGEREHGKYVDAVQRVENLIA